MAVAPNRPKGPPLSAMRAFEAAARLESFVSAAEELNVTAGAVSQQIKALESWTGCALFQRHAQGVALTATGRALLPDFVAAFDALGAATQALRRERPDAEVHIAALPSVAQLWLAPRLARIRAEQPGTRLSVTAMETPPNLSRDLFDMSLFFLEAEETEDHIAVDRDILFPVCAPSLARSLAEPGAAAKVPLLHDQNWSDDWQIWCDASGMSLGDLSRGPRYSLYSLALEEAKAGAGLLMGHRCLVAGALAAGALVAPFDAVCDTGRTLVLGLPPKSRRQPDAAALVDLLLG